MFFFIACGLILFAVVGLPILGHILWKWSVDGVMATMFLSGLGGAILLSVVTSIPLGFSWTSVPTSTHEVETFAQYAGATGGDGSRLKIVYDKQNDASIQYVTDGKLKKVSFDTARIIPTEDGTATLSIVKPQRVYHLWVPWTNYDDTVYEFHVPASSVQYLDNSR